MNDFNTKLDKYLTDIPDEHHDGECEMCRNPDNVDNMFEIGEETSCESCYDDIYYTAGIMRERGTRLAFKLSRWAEKRMSDQETVKMAESLLSLVLCRNENNSKLKVDLEMALECIERIEPNYYKDKK